MFEDPACMLNVFCRDGRGGWKVDEESERRADEAGLGFKTERGDRAAVILTPEDGEYSQMMLNMTRSIGDFYHQKFGVTWKPDVITRKISDLMGGSQKAVLCIASDGVWDMWTFEEAMAELANVEPASRAAERKQQVMDFFETSRQKGQETFADSADNLTGVVVYFDP
uniref:PPM-type phosphatase domain-containing protein n=2 Tax=Chrysotila carterae TaxID=13221 RepID=A0A7S4B5V7_CHRCT